MLPIQPPPTLPRRSERPVQARGAIFRSDIRIGKTDLSRSLYYSSFLISSRLLKSGSPGPRSHLIARRNIAAVQAAFFILVLPPWRSARQIVRREQSIEAQFAVGGSAEPRGSVHVDPLDAIAACV
jgi:hypothetical protein